MRVRSFDWTHQANVILVSYLITKYVLFHLKFVWFLQKLELDRCTDFHGANNLMASSEEVTCLDF
jgi:hypothetical protein